MAEQSLSGLFVVGRKAKASKNAGNRSRQISDFLRENGARSDRNNVMASSRVIPCSCSPLRASYGKRSFVAVISLYGARFTGGDFGKWAPVNPFKSIPDNISLQPALEGILCVLELASSAPFIERTERSAPARMRRKYFFRFRYGVLSFYPDDLSLDLFSGRAPGTNTTSPSEVCAIQLPSLLIFSVRRTTLSPSFTAMPPIQCVQKNRRQRSL